MFIKVCPIHRLVQIKNGTREWHQTNFERHCHRKILNQKEFTVFLPDVSCHSNHAVGGVTSTNELYIWYFN